MNTGILGLSGPNIIDASKVDVGEEIDYAEFTAGNVTVTATSEATANALVTGNPAEYDGNTIVMVDFYCLESYNSDQDRYMFAVLFDYEVPVGVLGRCKGGSLAGVNTIFPIRMSYRFTPAAGTHKYSVRGWCDSGTQTCGSGVGGSAGVYVPMFIRITKVGRKRS